MADKETPSELIRAEQVGAVNLWALPSFDEQIEQEHPELEEAVDEAAIEQSSEEVAVEEVKPLTLDELEAIRQDAYNEGFSTGEKDGFCAGQLKARQEAEVALTVKLKSLEQVMGCLLEPIAEQDQQIEAALVELVVKATREIVRRELKMDSSQIRQVLSEALKLLPMGAENIRIFVNAQDFELVKALRERHEESWRIIEDDSLLPGGCRVETAHSRLDASIDLRSDQVIKQLFEQQFAQAASAPEADLQIDLGDFSEA